MTTPNGLPAWTRTATHTIYGGHTEKENYLSLGMIDATTDLDAAHIQRLAADLEAVVRTAPMATITLTMNDAGAAAPTITSVFMMTGVNETSYEGTDAPAGYPTAARVTDGVVTVSLATTYSDPYGVAGDYAIGHAKACFQGTVAGDCTVTTSGSDITVYAWDATGAAFSDGTISLTVW